MSAYLGWGGKDSSHPHYAEADKAHFSKGNGKPVSKAAINESQPNAVHKVVKCHIMKNKAYGRKA